MMASSKVKIFMINSLKLKRLLKMIFNQLINNSSREIKDEELEYIVWLTSLYIQLSNIPGHIAEIGVASGRNAVIFGKLIKLYSDTNVRQYIGFDTFSGYEDRDLNISEHLKSDAWKNNSKIKVMQRCEKADVSELVEIFEGDAVKIVPKVLSQHTGKKFQKGKAKIALLYIDCNAYTPAIESMRNFYDYMIPGGIIAIDEKFQGDESLALSDFAAEKGAKIQKFGSNSVPMIMRVRTND
jgi:hypothetical protein